MTDIRDKALSFEAVKIGMTQNKDGHVLRLSIHPNDAPETLFRDWVGARYQVAMVLIDDEGKPAQREEDVQNKRLVTSAVMLCKEPDFQAYAFKVFPIMDGVSEDNASTYLRTACKIDSRSELATNPEMAFRRETMKAKKAGRPPLARNTTTFNFTLSVAQKRALLKEARRVSREEGTTWTAAALLRDYLEGKLGVR
jgi:hypothetical protein